MKFTKDWLDIHLKTNKSESQIIQKLNSIGLEVEKVEPVKNELSDFIVAKIIKANKHPNADRLKLCDVDIGKKDTLKVVCGAPNARDGLLTIYAPPGSVIPKNGMKLEVSKIRGETSYGMLCSESELKLSNESEGIIDLNDKYKTKIGKSFFGEKKGKNVCYNQVKSSSAQSFSLWQLLMLASFIFFVAGSPYFNQVDFWRSEFDR